MSHMMMIQFINHVEAANMIHQLIYKINTDLQILEYIKYNIMTNSNMKIASTLMKRNKQIFEN